jgi:uncharacterized membrane protein HdeD (DUF308 family)
LFGAKAVFQILVSFPYRDVMPGSWGWTFVSGIADSILAGILFVNWPVSAASALGLLVGIDLSTGGYCYDGY